jgi:hypothetical protein
MPGGCITFRHILVWPDSFDRLLLRFSRCATKRTRGAGSTTSKTQSIRWILIRRSGQACYRKCSRRNPKASFQLWQFFHPLYFHPSFHPSFRRQLGLDCVFRIRSVDNAQHIDH